MTPSEFIDRHANELLSSLQQLVAISTVNPPGENYDLVTTWLVRELEAAGAHATTEAAPSLTRKGGRVLLFGGCASDVRVSVDPSRLHYDEVNVLSSFHHTPRFIREALDTVARGELRASDLITGEIPLSELPGLFQHMKNRNGELKTAVVP